MTSAAGNRTASIANDKGAIIFEQRDLEVPADWSQTATNIVASKYLPWPAGFAGPRVRAPAQLIHRGGRHDHGMGASGGYFKTSADAGELRNELAHLVLTQKASFNSPVWFTVGVAEARGYGWVLR